MAKAKTTTRKTATKKAPAAKKVLKPGESIVLTKPKRKKRVMTAEQKAAAAERLRKAREKRLKENPPQYKSIHPDVVALPEDATLSMKNVKEWIKSNKDLLAAEKRSLRAGKKDAERKILEISAYISNMENYLRSGTWNDLFYGERRNSPMKNYCHSMAFDKNGFPKRTVGVYYPDIGAEWTHELDKAERERRSA